MTENEALKRMKMCIGVSPSENIISSLKLMSDALDELKQYRAIGTVEELEAMKKSTLSAMELVDIWCVLEDLKKYSAIGTIEEFIRAKEMEAVFGQVKWERDVAIGQIEEIGVSLGQKMDDIKALKEKSVAKKPLLRLCVDCQRGCVDCDRYEDRCPTCNGGLYVESGKPHEHCPHCGQKLDWQ